MVDEKVKSLWGQDFRVVSEGLAETDVVIFVEKMMQQHRESLTQLDHIAALHELATKTVEDAERLANDIKEQARLDAEAESAGEVAEARSEAREMLDRAELAAKEQAELAKSKIASLNEEYGRKARQRLIEIDVALRTLKDAAQKELSSRMPGHYIGKHLYRSVLFLPAFENLMNEVRSGFLTSGPEASEPGGAEEVSEDTADEVRS